jgi:chromate reductase
LALPEARGKGSYNRLALRAAQPFVPEGANIENFDLRGIPPLNQDQRKTPPPIVAEFKKNIRAADAILFATPEYKYGVPGVLETPLTGRHGPSATARGRTNRWP